jgi:prophage antirepressor-like protein
MSEFNIYNVFLHAKHTYHHKTQSWLEQRLVERVRQKGKSGAKWDTVNITALHQISWENTPSVNLRMKKKTFNSTADGQGN